MNNSPHNLAFDHYQTAEHLLHKTFPVTKEPKLLPAIVKSISNSLEYALEAILIKEKIVPPPGLLKKVNTLRPVAQKYHLSMNDIVFMLRIHEILSLQKQSPVEFKRRDNHIICSDNYDVKVISVKEIEVFLQQTQNVLNSLKQL